MIKALFKFNRIPPNLKADYYYEVLSLYIKAWQALKRGELPEGA